MNIYEFRAAERLRVRKNRLLRNALAKPTCRPVARHLIEQAPYIPSPEKGKRWVNGKQVPRKSK